MDTEMHTENHMKKIIIGTRGSKLALAQAEAVKDALTRVSFHIEAIKTKGDKILDAPLSKIGDKGLFTKEIEEKLLDRTIDMAVHSMKDMPTTLPPGLLIAAVTRRMDPSDAFISRDGRVLSQMKAGDTIATSSLRRRAQLKALIPGLRITDIRGNIITRLEKMQKDRSIDGLILAHAGIARLHMEDVITEVVPHSLILPPVGQAALAIETRAHDTEIQDIVNGIHDRETGIAIACERAFLASLEGGCQVPIAAHASLDRDALTVEGLVASLDGSVIYRETLTGTTDSAVETGRHLAHILLDRGAGDILDEIYSSLNNDS